MELSPANIVLMKPCLLKIPHFAADPRGEKQMFIAARQTRDTPGRGEAEDEDEGNSDHGGRQVFEKLQANAQFNIGTGYSTVWITKLGTFYVCSSIEDGIDYAVTSFSIPSHVPGTTFNAVAFDWIEGEANLWTRTSLDRPPGKDGPVYVRRKAKLTVDFDPQRINSSTASADITFPETFALAGQNYNLLTGKGGGGAGKGTAQDEPFDTIEFQMLVVPGSRMELIGAKQAQLEDRIKDLKVAEDQAEAVGQELEAEAKQPYLDLIEEARVALKQTRQACLPWAETPAAATEHKDTRETEGSAEAADQSGAPRQSPAPVPPKQEYRELPAWEGKDMSIVFGARMIPDAGFQEDHFTNSLSIVMAKKDAEERRLLEVPAMPDAGGRFRKVWVGPPQDRIFTYPPTYTRASYAELVVNVRLGAWTHRCVVTLSSADQSLADLRTIVQSHCYGRDLSEARFVLTNGQQVVDFSKEHLELAQSQRPSIGLWGSARRANVYFKNNIVLSFTSDLKLWVTSVYENLKSRGFPVWMDTKESGANSIAGLPDAAMLMCFLTPTYIDTAHTREEYAEATKRTIPKLHIWTQRFETRGWLKTIIREQKGRADAGDASARHHELTVVKAPLIDTLSSNQLDSIAMAAAGVLPAPPAPINIHTRQQAPNAEMPPVSVVEREEILKPFLALALEQHALSQAATKKGKKGSKK